MVLETMRRALWVSLFSLAAACGGKGDDDGGGTENSGDCACLNGAYVPVCGVDGMTYDATCGLECVPVEIECMSECPCNASSDGPGTTSEASSGATTSTGTATGTDTATETAAETTMGVDPCDCPLGAYYPVCGVDGMTYDATCGLECVPVEILCMGVECPCPELACGDMLVCGSSEQVCTTTLGGPAGAEPSYSCDPIPDSCDGVVPPTCDCVAPRFCQCMEDPPGYFQVTCAAP